MVLVGGSMTMFPIAHAGGVISALLYLVRCSSSWRCSSGRRSTTVATAPPADDEETEPTLDEIMEDDKR